MAEQANPTQALDAMLQSTACTSESAGKHTLEIHPVTIGRWALLELLESPFVMQDVPFTLMNVLPAVYVMAHDFKDLAGYDSHNIADLKKKAITWADEALGMADLSDVISTIVERISVATSAAPQGTSGSEEDGKKKQD